MESFKKSRFSRPAASGGDTESTPLLGAHGGKPRESSQEAKPSININPYVHRIDPQTKVDREPLVVIKQGYKEHVRSNIELLLGETKTKLDDIPSQRYQAIRNNNNPYEKISFFFQNRAAFKMVELDDHFNLVPKNPDKVFLVADICSGPGGFSEYILTKLKWKAKVFGFTLRNEDDFRVDNFNVSSIAEAFHAHYGVSDPDGNPGNGDITSLANLKSLDRFIGEKVDLVTADGGFEISDFNNQEIFARKMLLGEFLTPLMILKVGGDFVCKLFTTFTEFSTDLLFLTTCLFDEVYFTKPISSRVANSERFLVAKGFRGIGPGLLSRLQRLMLFEGEVLKGSTQAAAVPDSFLDHSSAEWKTFAALLEQVNDKVTRSQIYHLNKIIRTANSRRNKEQEEANAKIQEEIADKVSRKVKIHRDPRVASPPGWLYYDPLYGQSLFDEKKTLGIISANGGLKGTYIVKTGFNKRPRQLNVYYVIEGHVKDALPNGGKLQEGLIDKMPYDTIIKLEQDQDSGEWMYHSVVYSFLPKEFGKPNYNLLLKSTELRTPGVKVSSSVTRQ